MSGVPYSQVNRPPSKKLICKDKSRARQSEKDACDINVLMAKYHKTGVIPQDIRPVVFADVSTVPDYRSALDRIGKVQSAFMELPPGLRSRFDNDPAIFLDFTSDPANVDELVELGLIEKAGDALVEPVVDAPAPQPSGGGGEPPPAT